MERWKGWLKSSRSSELPYNAEIDDDNDQDDDNRVSAVAQKSGHKIECLMVDKFTRTQIHKYTNTQIHKDTNTARVKVAVMPSTCYIFEKVMVQGPQK